MSDPSTQNHVLRAMVEARRVLMGLESMTLEGDYRFSVDVDDHEGWPKLTVRLFCGDSGSPEIPFLEVFVQEEGEKTSVVINHPGLSTPEYADVDSAEALSIFPDILKNGVDRFIALVERFVSNVPLSGAYAPDKKLIKDGGEDEELQDNGVQKSLEEKRDAGGAITVGDDFFKMEDDASRVREEIITADPYHGRKLTENTSILIRQKTTRTETGQPGAASFKVGSVIEGRYEIAKHLGNGGMGSVYLVKDRILAGEHVAMKVLYPEYANQPGYTERFLREVQLMRRINHSNVIRTYDVGINGDLVYFTMEYVTGEHLGNMLDSGNISERDWIPVITQICKGLEAIHGANIIHRDLTPDNILIFEDGSLKITDFGVARPEESQFTMHKEIIGSVSYIAPEIWLGGEITHAIDLYSLGVVLYEMTTGVIPFQGKSIPDSMRMHVSGDVIPPADIKKGVPGWLSDLTMSLLEKKPADRPESVAEVLKVIKENG